MQVQVPGTDHDFSCLGVTEPINRGLSRLFLGLIYLFLLAVIEYILIKNERFSQTICCH